MKLKRYSPDLEGAMDEMPDGVYVLFDDVKEMINIALHNQEKDQNCQSCGNNDAIFTDLNEAIGDES